jgi:hypothetical protein
MFNLQDSFYRPLWLRLGIVLLCLGWAAVEVANGAPGWAMLFGAVGLYAAWQFFVVWNPRDKATSAEEAEAKTEPEDRP